MIAAAMLAVLLGSIIWVVFDAATSPEMPADYDADHRGERN